jgi:phosphatidylserine/phosphatidylglycerophosphate/cardiolipin synthase-like enzyme
MIMNGPGKISIMVGGKVVGMMKSAQLTYADNDEPSTKEFSDLWRTPSAQHSWDIECQAVVSGDAISNVLKDMSDKVDVTITTKQPQRRLPRKMKKAYRSDYPHNTKWLRKVRNYIQRNMRNALHIRNAEMVLTPEQRDRLAATIRGGTIDR